MALTLTCRLISGSFDAATADPARQEAEWPPHPLRVFSALVDAASAASAPNSASEALRWLEALAPPMILAARHAEQSTRGAWVPVNALPDKPAHTLYPGRASAGMPKQWPRAYPASSIIRLVWIDADPGGLVLATLQDLARCIAYLGRASSPVVVSLHAGEPPQPTEGEGHWVPDPGGALAVRVPFPGALDALRSAFARGQLPHEVRREVAYRAPGATVSALVAHQGDPVAKSPYQNLLTFCLRPALGADASVALALTTRFRGAVVSRIARDVPSAVHGHDRDGPHVSWLALPFAAHAQASGRVLGVGVAIPTGMPDADRSLLLRALIGSAGRDPMTELKLPKPLTSTGSVGISRWSQGDPWAASPWRWIGPSRRWATVTPVVWDRFTRNESELEDELRESLAHGGYPDPALGALAWSRTPFVRGAARPQPHQVHREGEPIRPFRHVLVEFSTEVRGPVAVGRLRHFGVGLFVPMDSNGSP